VVISFVHFLLIFIFFAVAVDLKEVNVSLTNDAWLPSADAFLLNFLVEHDVTAIYIGLETAAVVGGLNLDVVCICVCIVPLSFIPLSLSLSLCVCLLSFVSVVTTRATTRATTARCDAR
jgi:hypothetical protein